MEPCKVLRARSKKGIIIKIFLIIYCEFGMIEAVPDILMLDKTINGSAIGILYLIRIIGIVAGSLVLRKVKNRGKDVGVSLGISTLANTFNFFILALMTASEETEMLFSSSLLLGLIAGVFPAFCSIALFDCIESAKIAKKEKKGIYIPSEDKLDI